jgi:DNA-binding CsgD family transcriptional regulator
VWEQARSILGSGSGPAEATVAATVLSNLSWSAGKLTEGLRLGRDAVRRAERGIPKDWYPYPYLALAHKYLDLGAHDAVEPLTVAAEAAARRFGSDHALIDVTLCRSRSLLALGEFRKARDQLRVAVERARSGKADWAVRFGLMLLTLAELRRGDVLAACESMTRCRAAFADDQLIGQPVSYRWGEFRVSTVGLSPARAVAMLSREYAELLAGPELFVMDTGAAPWLVRLARAAGDTLLAASIAAAAENLAAANPGQASLEASSAQARALLDADAGTSRQAAARRPDGWAGQPAAGDAGQAAADGGSTPDQPPARAGGLLTVTERRVADLVAAGLTNQQIARSLCRSPHTVNYHLRRIFQKLNIRSRVELATYFLR